jgi:hypothetical protein
MLQNVSLKMSLHLQSSTEISEINELLSLNILYLCTINLKSLTHTFILFASSL